MNRTTIHNLQPYLMHLVDSLDGAVIAVDQHDLVTYANDNAMLRFRQHAGDHITRGVAQHLDPHLDRPIEQSIAIVRTSLEPLVLNAQCGVDESIAIHLTPLRDPDHAGGVVVLMIDLSAWQLHQLRAGQKLKMQALGTMSGKLAHHFNNILGGVVTRVDFAKESTDPRLMRKTLKMVAESLQRATVLLEGLLAFAEADHRQGNDIPVHQVVTSLFEQSAGELPQDIELVLDLQEVPRLEVPATRFRTALQQLIDNAVESMPDGGRLTVRLLARLDAIICQVEDTGGGIDSRHLEHAFEPFYTTKAGQDELGNVQHPGLGLSVAMGLVQDLGGDISICSTPQSATLVEIRLPWSGGSGSMSPD